MGLGARITRASGRFDRQKTTKNFFKIIFLPKNELQLIAVIIILFPFSKTPNNY
jgi:hypothetical protein